MPRLIHVVPKYRKHRATGQAVVTLNGRDHYLGPHGTKASRHEYDRLIGEWLTSGRTPHRNVPSETTVVELCATYLEFARNYYVRDGQCTGEVPGIKSAMKLLCKLYGRHVASEFGPLALKSLRDRWVVNGWSRSFVNIQSARIKRMFKWGVSEQLVSPDVYQAIASVAGLRRGKTDARETEPILPVDDVTIDATLPHLPEVVADMVRLQRLTGMRPAELCILRPCDLDRNSEVWTYVAFADLLPHASIPV